MSCVVDVISVICQNIKGKNKDLSRQKIEPEVKVPISIQSEADTFKEANNILRAGVKGISELITKQGYINLDFADIRAIMKDSGVAMLGFGEADGENRAVIATEQALNSPLLEKSIEGSRKILLNITGGLDLQLTEIQEISNTIIEKAGSGTANLIFGTVIDEETNGITG